MKKLSLWGIALLAVTMFSCDNNDDNIQYTAEDFAGAWIWTMQDNEFIPSDLISVSIVLSVPFY
ncbi:MAG: hypothetical protein M0P35_10770 [Bacteroidales bacterium]|nr:hypothetical protein [Bacteroidales bacterium]MDD2205149.1 hypothetical protein [Bacteroidales bacterium]